MLKYFKILFFILAPLLISAQETFTSEDNFGNDTWIDGNDWTASVGADRIPDCTNAPITIIIPAGVTTIFRNYPGDIAEFTCVVNLEIYGTLSFRNNDSDPTGLHLNNPSSSVFIAQGATLETIVNGNPPGDHGDNYLQVDDQVLFNGSDYSASGGYTEDEPGGITYNAGVPLPIDLFEFIVRPSSGNAEILWSTLSELNNSYFTLLRSKDGIQFDEIAKVDEAGTSNFFREYSFTDQNPLPGLSYYQLMQTDYDGKYEMFPIVSFEINELGINSINAYPNPTKDFVQISANSNPAKIFDLKGVDLSDQIEISEIGHNKLSLDLRNLNPGTYVVRQGESKFQVIRN